MSSSIAIKLVSVLPAALNVLDKAGACVVSAIQTCRILETEKPSYATINTECRSSSQTMETSSHAWLWAIQVFARPGDVGIVNDSRLSKAIVQTEDRRTFNLLIAALSGVFRGEGREGGLAASIALQQAESKAYRHTVSTADPGALLEGVCQLDCALPLASQVLACRSMLDWTTWEGEGLSRDVSANLFTTELVGPDGHIAADDVRVGLLASGPNTNYPISSHSGEETYYVIAGLAEWTAGDQPYAPKPPGSFVHHPSWVRHGRRTRHEPFLGAWRWSGDLDLSTFTVASGS